MSITESHLAILLFVAVFLVLLLGYPVAFALGGTALWFALLGYGLDLFDTAFLEALPNRIFGIMTRETLLAVPLFIFMGTVLERTRIAEELLESLARLCGRFRGGMGIATVLVGMLMAASTGIVGATVVTLGLLALPTMLRRGYPKGLSCGLICASGTLGQLIPPSIVLVLLGDVLSAAYQQAQLEMGVFSPRTVSVGDLFAGALIPGLLLVGLYLLLVLVLALLKPEAFPPVALDCRPSLRDLLTSLLPPLFLIVTVLGSILIGLATPTEAAAIGGVGAMVLAALKRQLNFGTLQACCEATARITSMVFMILIGAAIFSLVFRGFYGDEMVVEWLSNLPGGEEAAFALVMGAVFLLGFVLDFIEISFVVLPIVGPALLKMGLDPVWLGVLVAVNLQTSFLTPPFGFSLFYLRGVAPPEVRTSQIYLGVVPFILLQLLLILLLYFWPELVTWLPGKIYG